VISVRYNFFFVLIIVNGLVNVARSVTYPPCPGVPGSSLRCDPYWISRLCSVATDEFWEIVLTDATAGLFYALCDLLFRLHIAIGREVPDVARPCFPSQEWFQPERILKKIFASCTFGAPATRSLRGRWGCVLTYKKTNKLRGLSPHANYTDRAAAAGRRS